MTPSLKGLFCFLKCLNYSAKPTFNRNRFNLNKKQVPIFRAAVRYSQSKAVERYSQKSAGIQLEAAKQIYFGEVNCLDGSEPQSMDQRLLDYKPLLSESKLCRLS